MKVDTCRLPLRGFMEALVNKKVDMAWVEALTFAQANLRSAEDRPAAILARRGTPSSAPHSLPRNPAIKGISDLKGKDFTFALGKQARAGHRCAQPSCSRQARTRQGPSPAST